MHECVRKESRADAARKGMSVEETEKWLSPILNYTPGRDDEASSAVETVEGK